MEVISVNYSFWNVHVKFTFRGSVKSTSLVSFRPRGTKGILKVSLWKKKKNQIFFFCYNYLFHLMTGSSYTDGIKRKVYSSFLHKKICLIACSQESYLPALFFFFHLSLFFLQAKGKRVSKAALLQFSSTAARRCATVRAMISISISNYNQYLHATNGFLCSNVCNTGRSRVQSTPAFTGKGLEVGSPWTT